MKDRAYWLVLKSVGLQKFFGNVILKVTSNCLKREVDASPVVKVKRKYVRKKKSEAGEVAQVKSKRKVVDPVEGDVARRRYRCEHCNYSSNNQVSLSYDYYLHYYTIK